MKFIDYCRSCGSDVCIIRPAILAPFIVKRIFNMEPESTKSLYGIPNQVNYFPCKTLMCEICGFVGVNILFDNEEMGRLYLDYRDEGYNKARLKYEPNYKWDAFDIRHAYVDDVSQPFIKENVSDIDTLIDFGGYDGLNTPKIGNKRFVYDICNVESKVPITDTIFNCDLITCMHVLEHAPNPNEIIEEIKGKAKYYYFEVPNENIKDKEFWHEHINCFTIDSFVDLLSRHFKVVATKEDKFLHVLCENI
jgi:hypothetical protein